MNTYYKGVFPEGISPTKNSYLCKKSLTLGSDIITNFVAGKYYNVTEIQHGPTIIMQHYYFHCIPKNSYLHLYESRPYIYDYFYTDEEQRRIERLPKLKRINESGR